MSHLHRAETHVMRDYPKWIERDGKRVLVQNEDDEMEIDNQAEKDRMVTELREDYGKEIDLRAYRGPGGFGTLKAYYEAVVAGKGED